MNANGGAPRNLTRNPAEDLDAVWSPDGKRIAFVRAWQVYVMNADGSKQRRLTLDGPRNLSPSWSPDGQKIAFDRRLGWRQPKYRHGNRDYYGDYRASVYEVHVINADGNGQTRLTRGAEPLWSPDGRRIAFRSVRDGEIYVMNADGSRQRNVSRNPAYSNCCFSWSPGQK